MSSSSSDEEESNHLIYRKNSKDKSLEKAIIPLTEEEVARNFVNCVFIFVI